MSPKVKRFFYRTLEPVHVGAGGYRLGRVDKTICRELGTNLPKIPGTSISGAVKYYAALAAGKPEAAGVAKYDPKEDKNCPIFYTFGHASDGGGGNAGTIGVGDAYILFFPVFSTAGPVWVTCKRILEQAGATGITAPGNNKIKTEKNLVGAEAKGLSLGWLWFSRVANELEEDLSMPHSLVKYWPSAVVLVPDNLIAPIVNSNLEVRTSVAIDPKKGTAEDGKLFSYEAIPRDTVLFQEVVEDNYRGKMPSNANGWDHPIDVYRAGAKMMGTLGVGGMGTRGFGRMGYCDEVDVR